MIAGLSSFLMMLSLGVLSSTAQEGGNYPYGVDCSFPVHYKEFRCGDLLGDKQKLYDDFMEGCREKYDKKSDRCDQTENERLAMSLRQPQSMVNFTSTGFLKIKAPDRLRDLLKNHWEMNKDSKEEEKWPAGNVYVNHWAAPTYMVSVENTKLRGAGIGLKNDIWDAARHTIEKWTGMELKPVSLYGIRIYTEGAILSPHVDRLPLVSSAIVNVAQDVDEPWPLEVIDRHGNAVNVTMEPFDMVLYESHSLIHARPFPLKGRFMANVFIHFEPTGRPLLDNSGGAWEEELDDFLPPYVLPNSPESVEWRRKNPQGWKKPSPSASVQNFFSQPEAHVAAAIGDKERLERALSSNPRSLNRKDQNGWTCLHEAVRAGHYDIVDFLIRSGADKNIRTGFDHRTGSSPLNLAKMMLPANHDVIRYLISINAQDLGDVITEL